MQKATVLSQNTITPRPTIRCAIHSDLSNLVHDEALWQEIQTYDMDVVTETFARRNPEYADQAKVLEMECKRFMYLTVLAPNFELAPTKPIDELWHMFILFTKEYTDYCEHFNGRYVHHKPLGVKDHSIVFKRTQQIVTAVFDKFDNIDLWFLPMPATSCCSSCDPELIPDAA